jgi:2-iminobutanoate/2-iminopropanoate deaminase
MNDLQKTGVSTSHAPAAIGPYSQAVRLGDLVYTSGQIALDPATSQIVAGGIAEQTTRVLENIGAILTAAGSELAHVIKTVVFLKDMNDFAAMNAVYAQYLAPEGVVPPARSTVEVARLPKDVLVEIEVIAILAGSTEGDEADSVPQEIESAWQEAEQELEKLRRNPPARSAARASKKRPRR